ncbi:GGDEF domain-containing protein [Wenzhouxiangella marina]|uniref:diguanylate cyclase n=1 Tax=Wenzhouxiangella marina TaxID=1579979 RepID=A0A0K0XVP5_9GAMM|nr:diguanylate cyclase [Wenzhouxiangella marina]AKS41753.1 Putative sensorory transduction protein [Wenzhouxiangella marina]MBB6086485.1 diguanylate cyclase (GGDEF)-like protein [Wenzhouxiangella marina]
MNDRTRIDRALQGLVLCGAWLAVWGVGHLAEYTAHASVWYPPAALTFAALLVIGLRALPWLFVANFIATLWSVWLYEVNVDWTDIVGGGIANAIAHIGCYGIGAAALRRIASRQHHSLPRIVIAFLGIATASSMATTIGVITSLVLFGLLSADAVVDTWLAFWIGDFVALVVLGPLFGALLIKLVRQPAFWIEPLDTVRQDGLTGSFAVKLLVACLVTGAAMAAAAMLGTKESAFLIFFLLIPQMWLTHSESPLRTAASLGTISFLIVVLLAVLSLADFVFVYQFAIAIVATTAYFGLAIPLLASDNEKLREQLMFDRLTGAASRDLLLLEANRELARTRRGSRSCMAVIDLDRFKRINDRCGHARGDQALVALASIMQRHTRGTDIVSRYGGDEFVILFPDTSPEAALARLEVLREQVRNCKAVPDVGMTVSIGLSEARPDDDFQRWFERADAALLTAKRRGRDRVERRD